MKPFVHPWTLAAVLCAGCVTTRDRVPTREILMEPLHIGLKPDAELGLTDFDAATLFREGVREQQSGNCQRALTFYERLLAEFNTSRYVSLAAFNAGSCLEEAGKPEEAIGRYRIITEGLPNSKDWLDATFRQSTCLGALGRHQEASVLLGRLLQRPDLSTSDRLDAMVLQGEALGHSGSILEAEKSYRAALRLYRERGHDEYLDPAPAARAEFRLSELAEERFRVAPLRLPESQMELDLEEKAQRLLEAQAGYLRTIRHSDPEWATAAGYRIGTLYLQLHQAMQQAPVPDDLAPEEVQVYRDVLRKKTGVLLRKALRVYEMTLLIAERTRLENDLVRSVREEMERIQKEVLSLYEETPPAPQPAPVPPAGQ